MRLLGLGDEGRVLGGRPSERDGREADLDRLGDVGDIGDVGGEAEVVGRGALV